MPKYNSTVVFILVVGILIGAAIILCPIVRLIYVRCNYDEVSAVCIRVESYQSDDEDGGTSTVYKPVWEYNYDGIKYTSSMNESASFLNIPKGTKKNIYVCPEKPEKIYVPYKRSFFFNMVFGIPWLVMFAYFTYSVKKKMNDDYYEK